MFVSGRQCPIYDFGPKIMSAKIFIWQKMNETGNNNGVCHWKRECTELTSKLLTISNGDSCTWNDSRQFDGAVNHLILMFLQYSRILGTFTNCI